MQLILNLIVVYAVLFHPCSCFQPKSSNRNIRSVNYGIPPSSEAEPKTSKSEIADIARRLVFGGLPLVSVYAASSLSRSYSFASSGGKYPIYGSEEIMSKKSHGTSEIPVQNNLRWNCDSKLADKICCYNRHFAENAGYFRFTTFLKEESGNTTPITFYDSVTGKPLFIAPKGRTFDEFVEESLSHGWPSFRDNEVVWENVRCLNNGETVSVTGTHLGHNLPDSRGNRYCINLVSVAGRPETS